MSKYGENIYRRKDGRWEARYIFMRLPNGKAKYKSVYAKTHDIVKKKQLAAIQALAKEPTVACDSDGKRAFCAVSRASGHQDLHARTVPFHDRAARSSAVRADARLQTDGERTF